MSYIVTEQGDTLTPGTLRYGIVNLEPSIEIDSVLAPFVILESTLPITYPVVISSTGKSTISADPAFPDLNMFVVTDSLTLENVIITPEVDTIRGFDVTNANLYLTNCEVTGFGAVGTFFDPGLVVQMTLDSPVANTYDLSFVDTILSGNTSNANGTLVAATMTLQNSLTFTMTDVIDENNRIIGASGSVHISSDTTLGPRNLTINIIDSAITSDPGNGLYFIPIVHDTNLSVNLLRSTFTDVVFSNRYTGFLDNTPTDVDINVEECTFNNARLLFNLGAFRTVFTTTMNLMNSGFYTGSNCTLSTVNNNYVHNDTITVTGCTFANSIEYGLGLTSLSEGIMTTNIYNSTFVANTLSGILHTSSSGSIANLFGYGLTITGNGTGITQDVGFGTANVTLYNSINAGNGTNYVESNLEGTITYNPIFTITDTTGLNLQPLADNGGPTMTMAIDQTSTAFNAGDNAYVTTGTDQRGFPRIAYGTVDAGSYELQEPFLVCLAGDSQVLVNDKRIPIKSVKSGQMVFDLKSQKYIPVIQTIIMEKATHFMCIKQDSLGPRVPIQDLYVTAGHIIEIEGKHVKARDVPGAVRVKTEPQLIYTLVTEKSTFVDINGLAVYTWSEAKWREKGLSNPSWLHQ